MIKFSSEPLTFSKIENVNTPVLQHVAMINDILHLRKPKSRSGEAEKADCCLRFPRNLVVLSCNK